MTQILAVLIIKLFDLLEKVLVKPPDKSFFHWKTFNDQLALFLMVAIMGVWVSNRWLDIPDNVDGALIVMFALIGQFYFRKREGGS